MTDSDAGETTDDTGAAADFDVESWREELVAKRAEKDEFFGTHPHSPVPEPERDAFDGLDYFEPDPDYRVAATLHLVDGDDDEITRMETTTGGEQRYRKVGELTFELADETHALAAYRPTGEDRETLFVPFRDKTTGQQTYDAGRYMDLEAEQGLEDGETVVVDFNLAYTPFCGFSDAYACPLPPQENWLETVVEAGERKPGLDDN